MAPVNPDVQIGNAPATLGLIAKPVSEFAFNKEGALGNATMIAGIGKTIKEAATAGDELVKNSIERAVYQGVDAQKYADIGNLEQTLNVPEAQRQGDQPTNVSPADADQRYNIIPGATAGAPVPASLQATEGQINNLGVLAQTKAGLRTYYTGRLESLAKDLRSQYPVGYRSYIDQTISQASGEPIANAYHRNLQEVLQQSQAHNQQEHEKFVSALLEMSKKGIQGADEMYKQFSSGQKNQADVMSWIGRENKVIWEAATADAERNKMKANDEMRSSQATRDFTNLATSKITNSMADLNQALGTQFKTTGDLDTFLGQLERNEVPDWTDEKSLALGQILNHWKSALSTGIMQEAGTVRDAQGNVVTDPKVRSKLQDMTPSVAQKELDALFATHVDPMINLVNNKDWGLAHAELRAITAIGAHQGLSYMKSSNTTVRNYSTNVAGWRAIGGDQVASASLLKDAIAKDLPSELRTVVENQKLSVANGTQGVLESVKQLKKGALGTDDPDGPSKSDRLKQIERGGYDSLFAGITNVLKNPATGSPQIIKNLVNGTYGPDNKGLVNEFAPDQIDPRGKIIPGKYSLYGQLFQPKITERIYGTKDKDLSTTYRKAAENEFTNAFGEIANNINKVNNNAHYEFVLDPQTNKIGFRDVAQGPAQQAQNKLAQYYMKDINFLNLNINNLVEIAKKEGMDPNQYVRNILGSSVAGGMHFDPTSGRLLNRAEAAKAFTGQSTEPAPTAARPDGRDSVSGAFHDFLFPNEAPKSSSPTPSPDIKGASNAAHLSAEWGNPFSPDFESQHLTEIKAPNGQTVKVNKLASQAFEGFLKDLNASGYKLNSVSGHNLKMNTSDPRMLSQHSWGNALDINPDTNPYAGKTPFGSRAMKTDMPKNISELAAKWGLSWGGDWTSVKDPMHFEYTGKMPAVSNHMALSK